MLAHRSGGDPLYVAMSSQGESWTSNDGLTWLRGGQLAFPRGNERSVGTLVHGPSGFVAVGWSGKGDPAASLSQAPTAAVPYVRQRGLVWVSNDGMTWRLETLEKGVFIDFLAATDRGYEGLAAGPREPLGRIRSADGVTWTQAVGGAEILDLGASIYAMRTGGFLAVGSRPQESCFDGVATVWHSEDLAAWTPLPGDLGCGRISSVAGSDRGFAALGWQSEGFNDPGQPRVWYSSEGLAWRAGGVLEPMTVGHGRLEVAPDGTILSIGPQIWELTADLRWLVSADTKGDHVLDFEDRLAIACAIGGPCSVWIVEPAAV
jgi:hypothetical protein